MENILLRIGTIAAGLLIGGSMVVAGRRYYWLLLGVISMMLAAYFLTATRGLDNEWLLIANRDWTAVLIAVGVGLVAAIIGKWNAKIAATLIGFIAGAYAATIFDQILLYFSSQTRVDLTWWLLLILVIAGIIGAYLTRRSPDEAYILISVALGTSIIVQSLNLSSENGLTAIFTLSLALAGIVVQLAFYSREHPPIRRPLPAVPSPVSDDLPYE